MKKVIVLMVGSCLLAFWLFGTPGHSLALEKVRLLFTTTSYGIWYNEMTVGLSKAQGGLGFFEEEGLDVQHSGASGSTDAIKLVGVGQADVCGHAGYGPMIIAIEEGMPITAPFNVQKQNIFFIVVPKDSPYKDIKELKGKRIGVYSFGSDGVPMAKAMAQEVGLNPEKDIELVPIGLGAQAVDAIKTGKVVGGSFWDTGIALMEVQGNMEFRYLSTPGVLGTYASGYVANRDWLKKNPGTAAKFFRAIAKSRVFVQANPMASVKIHFNVFPAAKRAASTKEEEEKNLKDMLYVLNARLRMMDNYPDVVGKMGLMDKKKWAETISFYVKTAAIKKEMPAERVFTNEVVKEANNFDLNRIVEMAKKYK
jgi:NitT/TauT family transport system substrate-binding protein